MGKGWGGHILLRLIFGFHGLFETFHYSCSVPSPSLPRSAAEPAASAMREPQGLDWAQRKRVARTTSLYRFRTNSSLFLPGLLCFSLFKLAEVFFSLRTFPACKRFSPAQLEE